ncbi:hypothetical protein E2C01_007259 [Portunus trituberculatus]|uniref:Uncharacterized protein n=1 Tax=Portunus trituberculatus TaxID=210409 RepID=A0A5B7CXP4_PORTR|nr:hypothetical protein [Portunus trituberculatus]
MNLAVNFIERKTNGMIDSLIDQLNDAEYHGHLSPILNGNLELTIPLAKVLVYTSPYLSTISSRKNKGLLCGSCLKAATQRYTSIATVAPQAVVVLRYNTIAKVLFHHIFWLSMTTTWSVLSPDGPAAVSLKGKEGGADKPSP